MALVCVVYHDFVTFPFGILGQVWYLIVLIPNTCCLSYFSVLVCVFYARSTLWLSPQRFCFKRAQIWGHRLKSHSTD